MQNNKYRVAPRACLKSVWLMGELATLGALPSAFAAFPERPIRIIVPFPPGGASDVTARMLAEKFAQTWNVNVVVDNRTGATGIIGTDLVAKAAPDGYTLGLVALSFAINPAIHKLPYDSAKDFSFVTITASNPLVLVTGTAFPAKTVKDVMDLARAKPDALTFASSGTGSSPHMSAELFKLMTGLKITHVPYKGSTAAHPDLIAGRVNIMFDTVIATLPHIKAGRLRALGVTSKARSNELPDVPPVADSVPGYESTSWGVLMGPAKIPAPVMTTLNRKAVRVIGLPDIRERLARLGSVPVANSPDEARQFIRSELEKWTRTVKAAGITAAN
ncbi:MAG: tripartite tricarboxylate transporter substrate binding protein [Betaproteobacteria bacterium]|nr:tripartite tricarboxylate transporter substrate binding protein [Betaproteobacteria bacterium]